MRNTESNQSQRVHVEAASDLPDGITLVVDDQLDVISIYFSDQLPPEQIAQQLSAALNQTVTSWLRLPKPVRGTIRTRVG